MSRNKGSRQEDDNKSNECFDDIATGNPSINNSSQSTLYSKGNPFSMGMSSTKPDMVDGCVDSATTGNFAK